MHQAKCWTQAQARGLHQKLTSHGVLLHQLLQTVSLCIALLQLELDAELVLSESEALMPVGQRA